MTDVPSESVASPEHLAQIEVARINARQVVAVALITVLGGIIGAVLQAYLGQHGEGKSPSSEWLTKYEAVKTENDTLRARDSLTALERAALYQLTADRLESDITITGPKSRGADSAEEKLDIDYKRLRRAVFLNMNALQADSNITATTIDQLERRGNDWVPNAKSRLIAEFTGIRALRLRWLSDVVTPAIERQLEIYRTSPVQQPLQVEVPLPKEVWIVSHQERPPSFVFTSPTEVANEIDKIKSKIANGG